jgi:6-phosphogluconolactonase
MQGCKRANRVVRVYADYEALSRAAAELFVRLADEAARDRGRFNVALSGGRTPQRTYELLATRYFRERVDWGRVHVFWGDERCVPPDDPRSNAGMAHRKLLDHVPAPRDQIHPMFCADSARDAARSYESLLRSSFDKGSSRLDLALLGLGTDGHTASLFPGTPAVREKDRWVTEIFSKEEGIYRLTLTVPFLNKAAVAAFIVSGDSKDRVLGKVLCEQPEPDIPAGLIKPGQGGECLWLVDRKAASLLDA